MKRIALILISCIITVCVFAQNKIIVQGSYPDLYIIHKTTGKESLTSIGKLYNLASTPMVKLKDVSENGMVAAGTEVRISLNKNNFTQDGQQGEGETLIPLYHIVEKNENLFRIGQLYGKARIDFIREWNDMNNDLLQLGQKIIIGHLKVPREKAGGIIAAANNQTDNNDNGYEVKEEKKPEPKKVPEPTTVETKPYSNSDDTDEGYFVTQYPSDIKGKQQQIKTGDAATFKTTSGWSDKKYYVLMNDVVPGTIVRITVSNRSVCAKVLGALPDMKENTTLLVRMSNATASALHITDALFQVQVSYFK